MIIQPSPQYAPGSVTYTREGGSLLVNGEPPEGNPLVIEQDGSTYKVLAYQPADQLSWFPEPVTLADGESVTYSHG